MANQRFRRNFSEFESQAALEGFETFVDPFTGKVKSGLKLSKGKSYISATSIGAILSGYGFEVFDFYNDKSGKGRRYKFYLTDGKPPIFPPSSVPVPAIVLNSLMFPEVEINYELISRIKGLPGVDSVYEDSGRGGSTTLVVRVS